MDFHGLNGDLMEGFFQAIWVTQSSRKRGDFQSIPFPTTWICLASFDADGKSYIQIFSLKNAGEFHGEKNPTGPSKPQQKINNYIF